jgi:hypothetical protein
MFQNIINKYTVSFVCLVITIFIVIFQFIFPDLVPEAIQNAIDNAHTEQVGIVPILKTFLLLYTWSGIISFISGIVSAVIIFIKSQRE